MTLQVQILFMLIPFILQPILLLILKMNPAPGDWFADRRLISNGSYNEILSQLLLIVLVSSFVYYLTIEFCYHVTVRKNSELPRMNWTVPIEVLMILLLFGAAVLILSTMDISNPVLFALRKIGATTTCFALIFIDRISASDFQKWLFFLAGLILTIAETIGYGFTKAPILALAISYWIFTLQAKRFSSTKKILIGALLCLTLPILFRVIQTQKLGLRSISDSRSVLERYPDWMSPTLPFFQRFDLLSSLTDAYYAGVGTWLSIGSYIGEIYSALLWNYGFTGLNFGARWAKEVSSKSISGNAYTGVSLSQGPMAEGYIVLGIAGSALVTLVLVLFTILVCEKAQGSKYIAFIAVDMFAKNSLFEQGLVGNAERFTEALKGLVIFYIVLNFVSIAKKSHYPKI